MSVNHLLIWMSAHGEGSWQQFRAAVEELHVEDGTVKEDGEVTDDSTASDLPVYQVIRLALQRLGHVEFFTSATGKYWRVVPPTLAIMERDQQWVGIACGARSPFIYDTLEQLPGNVSWAALDAPGMPTRIQVMAPDLEDLHAAADSIGFLVQDNAPSALLAAIPPVNDPRSRFPVEPPTGTGWIIERFSPSTPRWVPAERSELDEARTGFFRFRLRHQRFHFLRWNGQTFSVPVQVGKFAVLSRNKRRQLLVYDSREWVFSVLAICRPPLIVERALVLCSGVLPRFIQSSRCVEYADIPPDIARVAAQLLVQEIEIR